jgi:hypothetical protein
MAGGRADEHAALITCNDTQGVAGNRSHQHVLRGTAENPLLRLS